MQKASDLISEMKRKASPKKAKASAWFFKTGKGEYGYGDLFFGLTVPEQRELAKKYDKLGLSEIKKLLHHKYHECRLTALFILVKKYQKGDLKLREQIAKFYLANKNWVNNWDLVDSSASYILGDYLRDKDRKILYRLARSKNLWDRRISIISAGAFIRAEDFDDLIALAEILLSDKHDLIHKAVGWMLREMGKKSPKTLEKFLDYHSKQMPRTMLRYSLEKMFPEKRKMYMARE